MYLVIAVLILNSIVLINISRSLNKIELILSLQIKNLDRMKRDGI